MNPFYWWGYLLGHLGRLFGWALDAYDRGVVAAGPKATQDVRMDSNPRNRSGRGTDIPTPPEAP